MIGMRGGYEFDRKALERRWKRLNTTPLVRASAYITKVARNSIRTARYYTKTGRVSRVFAKPSPPGKPPKSRAPGHPMRRILFEVAGAEACIGPVGLTSRKSMQTATATHEFGLAATRYTWIITGWHTVEIAGKKRPRPKKKRVTAGVTRYPKRPFMGPALAKAKPKLPGFWKSSLEK